MATPEKIPEKIPVAEMIRLAEQIAAFGFTREKSIEALKIAFETIGAEIDLGPEAKQSLDFGGGQKEDFGKTRPFARTMPMRPS